MTTTPVTRRAALIGAASAAIATTTACAAYGERADTNTGTSAGSTGGAAEQPAEQAGGTGNGAVAAIAATADIPVGGGIVLADQEIVLTQPVAGQFKGFSAVCTHQGCTVANVSGGTINCTCHGSKFAIADGAVAEGPAKKPLAAKKVSVSEGSVTLA